MAPSKNKAVHNRQWTKSPEVCLLTMQALAKIPATQILAIALKHSLCCAEHTSANSYKLAHVVKQEQQTKSLKLIAINKLSHEQSGDREYSA